MRLPDKGTSPVRFRDGGFPTHSRGVRMDEDLSLDNSMSELLEVFWLLGPSVSDRKRKKDYERTEKRKGPRK